MHHHPQGCQGTMAQKEARPPDGSPFMRVPGECVGLWVPGGRLGSVADPLALVARPRCARCRALRACRRVPSVLCGRRPSLRSTMLAMPARAPRSGPAPAGRWRCRLLTSVTLTHCPTDKLTAKSTHTQLLFSLFFCLAQAHAKAGCASATVRRAARLKWMKAPFMPARLCLMGL